MTKADFAILGSGAIGSIIGAHLARSGYTVIVLTRAERAQQIIKLGSYVEIGHRSPIGASSVRSAAGAA
jgi:ketopantoate reductase